MLSFKSYDDRPGIGVYWNGVYLGDLSKEEAAQVANDLEEELSS